MTKLDFDPLETMAELGLEQLRVRKSSTSGDVLFLMSIYRHERITPCQI